MQVYDDASACDALSRAEAARGRRRGGRGRAAAGGTARRVATLRPRRLALKLRELGAEATPRRWLPPLRRMLARGPSAGHGLCAERNGQLCSFTVNDGGLSQFVTVQTYLTAHHIRPATLLTVYA
eukprot:6207042-Pleurochrysis_carterae.AAC.3